MDTYGIWIIVGVIALIIDLLSATLFMLWVAGGCFIAAVVSWLVPDVLWAPWAAFAVSTAILLYLGLPLARRLREQKMVPSNVDALIGREGIVLETIDPVQNTGRIRVGSDEWRARAEERIESGQRIVVEGVEGATAIVSAQTDAASQDADTD